MLDKMSRDVKMLNWLPSKFGTSSRNRGWDAAERFMLEDVAPTKKVDQILLVDEFVEADDAVDDGVVFFFEAERAICNIRGDVVRIVAVDSRIFLVEPKKKFVAGDSKDTR